MHELSIARDLIDLVVEEAARAGASRVVGVKLRLGALAGVIPSALRTAFDAARVGTPAAGAILHIEQVSPSIHCGHCGRERVLDGIQSRLCPMCGTPGAVLASGKELELADIEVEC